MSTSADWKNQGNAAFKESRFQDAVDCFTKAIELDPEDHVLYSNRSGAWASLEKYEDALADADVCTTLKPDWAKGWARKGLAEYRLGKIMEAARSYAEGIKADPQNAACQQGLQSLRQGPGSEVFENQMKMRVAMKLAQDPTIAKYMEEDPEYIDRILGVVKAAGQTGNLEMALAGAGDVRVQEGINALFGVDAAAIAGATAASAAGQESSAKQTSDPVTEPTAEGHSLQPDTEEYRAMEEKRMRESEASALKAEGTAAYKKRDFAQAEAKYREAFEKTPYDLLLLNNVAAVYLEQDRFEDCLAVTQEALEKRYEAKADYSDVAKVYNRRAACFLKMKKFDEAIDAYKRSLTEDNNRTIRASLREAERLRDKWAQEQYVNPELAEQHKEQGNKLFKELRYPEAKAEYDEAIKRNPGDAKLYSNRAAAFMQLLEYPSALKDCEKAIELDPAFVKAYSRIGMCHYKMKEFHKAMTSYQKALQLDPEHEESRRGLDSVMLAIQQRARSTDIDQEEQMRAMADPEIQQIIGDPQMQLILQSLQSDPSRLIEYMKDQRIAEAINKLIAAGIIRTR
ncbi:putative stress-induced protein sti1 [Gregarina niphandrodes]|uniref:Hsp70-Hsp90 organising protein n=1 Tax=Gregarina niphandrodes TaxID=110365 RepID=A0A023BDM4_GRENI|nr:putative stress-induced protein sti1 [Gregarina niphandrodes]EZG88840.1 putative stress-induced protein sti1 [Gregarina niphandrodes]|eukprot:XP_011128539.1 putative stress-induced protein sti1 [Gregarina niphandrodes]